jgi:hypothetical protein
MQWRDCLIGQAPAVYNMEENLSLLPPPPHTDKKEKKIFLIYREIQSGAVANSYVRKCFLIYEEMRKYFPI